MRDPSYTPQVRIGNWRLSFDQGVTEDFLGTCFELILKYFSE